jgi:hypothetical protein
VIHQRLYRIRSTWLLRLALGVLAFDVGCRRPAPGGSLQRTRSNSGASLHWETSGVELEPVIPAQSTGVSASDLVRVLHEEVDAWNNALSGCSVPKLRIGPVRALGAARSDGHNLVVVDSSAWCSPDARSRADCYDPTLQAFTHVRPRLDLDSSHAGAILEADIEVNAVGFRWSADGTLVRTLSLRALIAHELGHVLGLDHSCSERPYGPDTPSRMRLPLCTDIAADERFRSIMYPNPTEAGRALVLAPTDDAIATLCSGIEGGR